MVALTPFTDFLCGYNVMEQKSERLDKDIYCCLRAQEKIGVLLTRGGLPKNEGMDRMEQCPECSNALVYQKLIEPFDSAAGRLKSSRSETNAKYIDFPPFCEMCSAYIIAESGDEEERRILLANLSEWMSNDDDDDDDDDDDHYDSNKAVGYTMLLQRDNTDTRSDRIKPLKGRILVSLCQKEEAREEYNCNRASNQADHVDIRNDKMDTSVASKYVLPDYNKYVLPKYNSVSGEVTCNNFDHVDKVEESVSFDETIVVITNSSESEFCDSSPSCECILVGSEEGPQTDFASNPTSCNSYEESQEGNFESEIVECSPLENVVEKSALSEIVRDEDGNDDSSLLIDVGGTEIEFLSRLNQAISKASQDQGDMDDSRDTKIDKSYDVLVDLAEGEIAFLTKVSTFILEGKRNMDDMEQQTAALVQTQQQSENGRDTNNESLQEISSKDLITSILLDNERKIAIDDQEVVQDNQEKVESPKKKCRRH